MGYVTLMEGEKEVGRWSQEDERRGNLTVMGSGGGGRRWSRGLAEGKKGKSNGWSRGLAEGAGDGHEV